MTFSNFIGIEVDGKAVGSGSYDAQEGSVKIAVKPSYLKTLSAGKHTLTAKFEKVKQLLQRSISQTK